MSGNSQTEYLCSPQSWENIQGLFRDAALCLDRKGSMETNDLFLDVKSKPNGLRGVWLAVVANHEVSSLKIEMHWITKNTGSEPRASSEMAIRIEKLLLSAGATCTLNQFSRRADRL